MILNFTKMHGCGNDYIYINCFEYSVPNPEELSIKLSNRRNGIGADGIILICPSDNADAKMKMFNSDGSEGRMCGNGIRCVGKYLYDNKIVDKREMCVETLSGIRNLKICDSGKKRSILSVDMGDALIKSEKVPVITDKENSDNININIDGKLYSSVCISVGNPHCVIFYEDLENLQIKDLGTRIGDMDIFPQGVNVEFIKVLDKSTIKMRVWERGSGETLACGTGACASVVAAVERGFCKAGEDITVKLLGGDLIVNYNGEKVIMTGPAEKIFEGEIEV